MKMKAFKRFATSLLVATSISTTLSAQSEPKEIVGQYFGFLGTGQFDKLMELFSEEVVWHQPGNSHLSGVYKGKSALAELFGKFMTLSRGSFKIERVADIMSNGKLVAATLTFSAQVGEQKLFMNGLDLMQIEDGKIIAVHLFSADQMKEDEFWDGARP